MLLVWCIFFQTFPVRASNHIPAKHLKICFNKGHQMTITSISIFCTSFQNKYFLSVYCLLTALGISNGCTSIPVNEMLNIKSSGR